MFSFVIYVGIKVDTIPEPHPAICVSWKCMLATFAARMKHKKHPIPVFIFTSISESLHQLSITTGQKYIHYYYYQNVT